MEFFALLQWGVIDIMVMSSGPVGTVGITLPPAFMI